MADHYQPKDSWQSFKHPLPQQSHFWRLHHLLVDTVLHFDHIKEVENDGDSYSGEVNGGKHEGGSVTLFIVETVEVGQFESKQSIVGHIYNEGDDKED